MASTISHRLQVHGHRGCRGLLPENTLPAFLHALHLGVDVLEMDVVLSADGQVVVAHEPWLSARLGLSPTGLPIDPQQERELNIYALPYAVIRQGVVGTLPHPYFPEQQLTAAYRPLLAEVLQVIEDACYQLGRPPVRYAIEIKSTPATDGLFHPEPSAFTATVLQTIPPLLLPRITLLSFDNRILQVAKKILPLLRLCLLVEEPFSVNEVFTELGFVPTVLGPQFELLSFSLLAELRVSYAQLEVVPWTINQAVDLAERLNWPLTGITTDYPNRLLQLL